jgi:hypothetical protein
VNGGVEAGNGLYCEHIGCSRAKGAVYIQWGGGGEMVYIAMEEKKDLLDRCCLTRGNRLNVGPLPLL